MNQTKQLRTKLISNLSPHSSSSCTGLGMPVLCHQLVCSTSQLPPVPCTQGSVLLHTSSITLFIKTAFYQFTSLTYSTLCPLQIWHITTYGHNYVSADRRLSEHLPQNKMKTLIENVNPKKSLYLYIIIYTICEMNECIDLKISLENKGLFGTEWQQF